MGATGCASPGSWGGNLGSGEGEIYIYHPPSRYGYSVCWGSSQTMNIRRKQLRPRPSLIRSCLVLSCLYCTRVNSSPFGHRRHLTYFPLPDGRPAGNPLTTRTLFLSLTGAGDYEESLRAKLVPSTNARKVGFNQPNTRPHTVEAGTPARDRDNPQTFPRLHRQHAVKAINMTRPSSNCLIMVTMIYSLNNQCIVSLSLSRKVPL